MLRHVPTQPRALGDLSAIVGAEEIARLRTLAAPLKGTRVLHVSSTAFGGGVAELLYTQVPLMADLGLHVDWRLLEGHEQFFGVTKAMHNGLQGAEIALTGEEKALYRYVNEQNAEAMPEEYDVVIVHDPQPAAIRETLAERSPGTKWIWRCHIDLTQPSPDVWRFLSDFVGPYDAHVFTLEAFVPPALESPHLALIPPSIDPLSIKNIAIDDELVHGVIHPYGIDPERPMVLQVSRFDPWKDPTGVIDAFRIARDEAPGLQLVMIASMAHDDPEGWDYFTRTEEHRAGDADIFLLSNLQEVGALAVNAFQRAADVVLQKSLREGFGLTVTEALWKRKPVIGGNVGGIRLQIRDSETGYLVDSVEQCAARVIELLGDPARGRALGEAGRALVRDRFLTTRSLRDYLTLFAALLS
ncbi:MAG TPA: glycosyltransferase [Actinomycetota bacterium]